MIGSKSVSKVKLLFIIILLITSCQVDVGPALVGSTESGMKYYSYKPVQQSELIYLEEQLSEIFEITDFPPFSKEVRYSEVSTRLVRSDCRQGSTKGFIHEGNCVAGYSEQNLAVVADLSNASYFLLKAVLLPDTHVLGFQDSQGFFIKDISRKDDKVFFTAIIHSNPSNYSEALITASCSTSLSAILEARGKKNGKAFEVKALPVVKPSPKGSFMNKAISISCDKIRTKSENKAKESSLSA